MEQITAFIRSPVGPLTTHFWGPTLNAMFVVQGFYERDRPAHKLSRNMQMILTSYSILFMRFSLVVKPRNYLLFCVHVSNTMLQANLLARRLNFEWDRKAKGLPIELSEEEKAELDAAHEAMKNGHAVEIGSLVGEGEGAEALEKESNAAESG
jgi:hypothetical protein